MTASPPHGLSRRGLLQLTAAVATGGLAPPTRADDAADIGLAEAQTIWARLHGDLSGRTVWFTTMGEVWGFRPQADDLALEDFAKRAYGYAGVAARKMRRRDDGAIVVREKSWAFYRDPESNRLGDRIANRWTGRTDTAPSLAGPPREYVLAARGDAAPAQDPYRMHVRRIGAQVFVSTSGLARFKPRDTTWYKLEGNFASHHCLARDLDDAALTHVPGTYCQNLVAEWQTWTGMHGQPGHILFKGDGVPLYRAADIPDELRQAIDAFFPGQLGEVDAWT